MFMKLLKRFIFEIKLYGNKLCVALFLCLTDSVGSDLINELIHGHILY